MTPSNSEQYPPAPDASGINVTEVSISPEHINALVQEPELLAQFLSEYNTQLNSIEAKKLTLAATKEGNRHNEEIGRQRITFAILGGILIVVLSSFLYSGLTKDKDMPKEVINMFLAAIGGGGAAVVLVRRRDD